MRHLGRGHDAAVEVLDQYSLTKLERKRAENRLEEAARTVHRFNPYHDAHRIAAQIERERT